MPQNVLPLRTVQPEKTSDRSNERTSASGPTPEQIQRRAYSISEKRRKEGRPGDETSDWTQAEKQLKAESGFKAAEPRKGFLLQNLFSEKLRSGGTPNGTVAGGRLPDTAVK